MVRGRHRTFFKFNYHSLPLPLTHSLTHTNNRYGAAAVGSVDGVISIWVTTLSKPLLVVRRLFEQSITDFSWYEGEFASTLLISSTDGTVAAIRIHHKDIGKPVSAETHDDILRDLYGGDAIDGNVALGGGVELPEDPLQLHFEMNNLTTKRKRSDSLDSSPRKKQQVSTPKRRKKTPVKILSPVQVMEMQKETKTSNGRRRIQPVFLTEADNFDAKNADLFSGSRNTPIRRGSVSSNLNDVSSKKKKKKTTTTTTATTTTSTTTTSSSKKPKQRRIALTSLSTSLVATKKNKNGPRQLSPPPAQSQPSIKVPSPPRRNSPPPPRRNVAFTQVNNNNATTTTTTTTHQRNHLPMTCEIPDTKYILTVRLLRNTKITRCSVTCTSHSDEIIWTDVVDGIVCAVTGNASFSAVAVTDGFVLLYSAAGRRLMAPVAVGDMVSILKCGPKNSFILMALCNRTGHCHVWNVSVRKRLLRADTLELLQSRSSRLFDADVSKHGVPTVHVQDVNEPHRVSAYAYDVSMEAWLRISSYDRFLESDYFGTTGNEDDGVLASIERRVQTSSGPSVNNDTGAVSTAVALLGSDESDSVSVTRAHLETQLSSSYLLRSDKEFRQWLQRYVEHLRDFKMIALVREMCESFLNYSGGNDESVSEEKSEEHDSWALDELMNWKPAKARVVENASTDIAKMSHDLGMKPKELLRSKILPSLRQDRFWQAVAREFQGLLSK